MCVLADILLSTTIKIKNEQILSPNQPHGFGRTVNAQVHHLEPEVWSGMLSEKQKRKKHLWFSLLILIMFDTYGKL